MLKDNQDILLDSDGDDLIVDGDFAIGDAVVDDCFSIMKLNQGALKYDALLGPNLIRMINGKTTDATIEKALRLNLERDNKMKFVKKLTVKNEFMDLKF